jgi:signal transduction histidine kinase
VTRRTLAISLARLAGAVLASGAVALAIARGILGVPPTDLAALGLFLAISGTLTLAVGGLVLWIVAMPGEMSMRVCLTVALATGSGVALLNVLVTAWLMFLSPHDLGLLLLLLVFSLLISLSFASVLSSTFMAPIAQLTAAVRRLAAGDLSVRAPTSGRGELAALAADFNRMVERVEATFQQERELETARRTLVASVSHDLRSPLASVRAAIEALHDGVVAEPDDVRRYIASALSDVAQVSALIDDLFELARLDAGAVTLQREETLLGDLVSDTLESMRPRAARHGVALRGAVEGAPVARIDVAKMQRVLNNLVENALRHTPAGGHIELTARETGEAACIELKDTGAGIAPGDLPHVFERFYRGDPARQRVGAGAGLGLAIVRGFVEAHGGTVWVDSFQGQGATFTLMLPRVTGLKGMPTH